MDKLHTRYAEANQLASAKASRSRAMADCVVVSKEKLHATDYNQSEISLLRNGARNLGERSKVQQTL